METLPNGKAPTPPLTEGSRTYQQGAKGGKVSTAWQWMWDNLSKTEYTEGRELAERAAARFELKQSTMLAQLSRMARARVLEVELRSLPIQVQRTVNGKQSSYPSRQKHAFYRIKAQS